MGDDIETLPPQTAPESFTVSLLGFPTEASARELGDAVGVAIRELSRMINAARLDGVTVAHDYPAALLQLDRGTGRPSTLVPTQKEVVGVAMAPIVLRSGITKAHIVVYAPAVAALTGSQGEDLLRQALYLLAHELGHVQDLDYFERACPGVSLRTKLDAYDGYLYMIANACWQEYAASRASAKLMPEQVKHYEETFVGHLPKARIAVDQAIAAYRYHGNVETLLNLAVENYGELLKYAGYLIGHLHGEPTSRADRATSEMPHSYFAGTYAELESLLADLWAARASWTGLSVFEPLKQLCWTCLSKGGLVLERMQDGGLYVHVPDRASWS